MRVTLFDSGVGNLHSLAKAIVRAVPSAQVIESSDSQQLASTDLLVLPGVGAFSHAAAQLAGERRALAALIRDGLPTIGVCLGMQLLLEESDEGPGAGLGVIAGRVERLQSRRLPHMGWSRVEAGKGATLPLTGAFYFAHSFACRPADASCVLAESVVGDARFPAVVRAGNALGFQFHPEKSSREGIGLLAAAVKQVTR